MRPLSQRHIIAAALIQLAVLCAGIAGAQLARRGGEFRINESPALIDAIGTRVTAVAAGPGGEFVVAWDSRRRDGYGRDVFARRFNADGEPTGSEFRVNSTTRGRGPEVAVADDGSFLIVWSVGLEQSAAGQAYDANGTERGVQIDIAEPEVDGPATSVVATDAGEFVVVWTNFHRSSGGYATRARRVSADGELLGPSFAVSDGDAGLRGELFGALARGPADSFLVVWYDESVAEIRGRHFTGDEPSGPSSKVADVRSTGFNGPEVCGVGGGFVVAWNDSDTGYYETLVQYRRYNEAGEAVTEPVRVTPPERYVIHGRPAVACASGGDFVLVWPEGSATSVIMGRTFVGDATTHFRIGVVGRPAIAMLSDTDFVVTWGECGPEARCDVFGQRFSLTGPADCPGDCNRNGSVTIDELVFAVQALLTTQPEITRRCLPADTNLDYVITVDELVAAVRLALQGCP